MNWIFLDFGSYRFKALKASIEGNQVELESSLSFPCHPEFFEGLDFPTSSAWAAMSVQLHENNWLSEEQSAVISQLPGSYLETRYLEFPFNSPKKIDRVLEMELESQIPFEIEKLIEKHHLLKGPGVRESASALVHVISYQRELIRKYEKELKAFQLSVPAFSADTLSLPSLRLGLEAPPVFAFLYFGHRKTHWVLMQQSGEVLAQRVFWWGGELLIRALAAGLQISNEEAEAVLKSTSCLDRSAETSDEDLVRRELLETQVVQFANLFRQSLKAHLQTGLDIPKPLPIFVMGGLSRLAGLQSLITTKLEGDFELQLQDYPIENLTSICRNLDSLPELDSTYGLLAQALSQTRSQKGRVFHFSESGFQLQQNIRRIKGQGLSLLRKVAVILIAPVAYLIFSLSMDRLEQRQLETSVRGFLQESRLDLDLEASISDIINQLRRMNRTRVQMQSFLEEDELSPLMILTGLSRAIPSRVKVDMNEFQVTETQVNLDLDTDGSSSHLTIMSSIQSLYPNASSSELRACDRFPNCQNFKVQFPRQGSGS
ncbi:MAG: hypothetical protein EA369_02700 [Bradymonadales bacterium]|nr:MAG: hypothetical protein EA369_02700 [Bradymonadales bacterium]